MNDIDKDWPDNLPNFHKAPRDEVTPVDVAPLPEPVPSWVLGAWGPKPDYYTAEQMNAHYQRGFHDGYERRHMEVLAALA